MKSMTYSEIKAKISSYAEVVNKSIDEKDEDSMTSYIYGIIEGLKWANVITDIEGQCEELQEIVREILNLPEPEPLHIQFRLKYRARHKPALLTFCFFPCSALFKEVSDSDFIFSKVLWGDCKTKPAFDKYPIR